jgi:pyridoxamine 5'-phosphate oxidase
VEDERVDVDDVLATSRISYERGQLDESMLPINPLAQFRSWLEEARDGGVAEPNAMTLATVAADGKPSARIVLLRGFDERGLRFFTNFESRKAQELAGRPEVALTFYWPPLERQVRVEGSATPLSEAESDAYFASRPRGHRIGAWASRQSAVVPDRAILDAQVELCERAFAGRDVDRPPYWGGYRIVPSRFEFWQGRPNRMHDRLCYRREDAAWRIERLSP